MFFLLCFLFFFCGAQNLFLGLNLVTISFSTSEKKINFWRRLGEYNNPSEAFFSFSFVTFFLLFCFFLFVFFLLFLFSGAQNLIFWPQLPHDFWTKLFFSFFSVRLGGTPVNTLFFFSPSFFVPPFCLIFPVISSFFHFSMFSFSFSFCNFFHFLHFSFFSDDD